MNSYTTGNQFAPVVAHLPGGDFVVAWQGYEGSPGDDDSQGSIHARLFDSLGEATTPTFQVNTSTIGVQATPSLAVHRDGFLVAWSSETLGGEALGFFILAQRFDAAGTALGEEIEVNVTLTDLVREPSIAALQDGRFAVAWDVRYRGTHARIFGGDGQPISDETRLDATAFPDFTVFPHIAADKEDGFMVIWGRRKSPDAHAVRGRYMDASGALAGDFTVDTEPQSFFRAVDIENRRGDFVITWLDYAQAGDMHRLVAVDDAGEPLGEIATIGEDRWVTDIAPTRDGFIAVGDRSTILAQRLDADGRPLGARFRVDTLDGGAPQTSAAVSAGPSGDFVVVWESAVTAGDDSSGSSIQMRRFPALQSSGLGSAGSR